MGTKLKCTKGPWSVTDDAEVGAPDSLFITATHRGVNFDVAEVVDYQGEGTSNTTRANAYLLAAAPELFQSLGEMLIKMWEEEAAGHFPEEMLERALAALKKARGMS